MAVAPISPSLAANPGEGVSNESVLFHLLQALWAENLEVEEASHASRSGIRGENVL
jgi:hypothetical protein